ncbi:enoyl-CoA hydratase/isomerase family protein [Xenophilus azovorans]|uniref:enoyl-CoA hydratase/isomerase family protein n=1 Tax=Xenophilus azovorans TaxID=151755 RepID=UPI00068E3735|nr:enoyl-CoA hydratase/isomerase family protein [Xenophilus azovorans]
MTRTTFTRTERHAASRVFTEICLRSPSGVNPLSSGTVAELRNLLREQAARADRHGLFIRAEGRAFCAGADVKEFRSFDVDGFRAAMTGILALYMEMIRFPQPIVALVQGDALGGGAALAFCSDYTITVRGAAFGLPEVHRGLAGGGWLMPRLLGRHRAAEMVLLGRTLDARRALELGLVGEVCEADELDARAQALAEELGALAPTGLTVAKTSLAGGLGLDLGAAMEAHIEAQTRAFAQMRAAA